MPARRELTVIDERLFAGNVMLSHHRKKLSFVSNLYGNMAFKNCSEVETHPKRICITKTDASWLLVGASLPIGSLVQSVSNTH